ncbi:MAG TPA: hypothetical protein VHN77_10235 [Phycisphaerales bacterium]|nr:hypothetical protein [Phycisphaerales bacterium]
MGVVPLKFLLYEHAVTNAARLAMFTRAAHGGGPRTLREDFSGTAALARAWLDLNPEHRAIAVDFDPSVTRHITARAHLRVVTADANACRARADIIAATNFAMGYFHERAGLVAYLTRTRSRLPRGGVFMCDMYGGKGAWTAGMERVRVRVGNDPRVPRSFVYEWDQVSADPATNLVENAIHFSWKKGGRTRRIDRAFTYHWRLWSIPELRDAVREAGFRGVDVYTRLADAVDHEGGVYVRPAESVDASWVVYVVARA